MDQEQIRRQPTPHKARREDSTAPTLNQAAPSLHDPSQELEAIDDLIRELIGPDATPDELIGLPQEQYAVRHATTSEEFVRNFRQHGGE